MSISIELRRSYVCDNCGYGEEVIEIPSNNNIHSILKDGWSKIKISTTTVSRHNKESLLCPKCTSTLEKYKGGNFKSLLSTASLLFNVRPVVTVDALVIPYNKYLLVKRKNPPYGWALPGGIMEAGETAEEAVLRELQEETGIKGQDPEFFTLRSKPNRDSRFHALSLVFVINKFEGKPIAADDAADVGWFTREEIEKMDIAFDHRSIIEQTGFIK